MIGRIQALAWSAWPILIVLVCISFLAPVADTTLFPVRDAQKIVHVERTSDRLCWNWISVKESARAADNLDAFLNTPSDRFVVAPFDKYTGMPWARSKVVGLGSHDQAFCVLLPPNVKRNDDLRLEQVAYYPGSIPLWHVVLRIPDVVSKGAADESHGDDLSR